MTIYRGVLGHAAQHSVEMGIHPEITIRKWIIDFYDKHVNAGTPLLEEETQELHDLGNSVLRQLLRYYAFWEPQGHRKVLHSEASARVRIKGIPVPVDVTFDRVVETDQGILIEDSKWVKAFRTPEMLELDGQIAIYHTAGLAMGYNIAGVVIDMIAPEPKEPKLNQPDKKTGIAGMSKVAVGDWPSYQRALIAAGLDPADYQDMREKLPETAEFRREFVYRSRNEVYHYLDDLVSRTKDLMHMRKQVYMCDDRVRCQNCKFRELCLEKIKTGDASGVVETMFEPAEDRYADRVFVEVRAR